MALNHLIDWMAFLSCKEERVYKEGGIEVKVYGEGDQSYVVLDTLFPEFTEQYIFYSNKNENSLFQFVCFLEACSFRLNELLIKVTQAEYKKVGTNDMAIFDHLKVARYRLMN